MNKTFNLSMNVRLGLLGIFIFLLLILITYFFRITVLPDDCENHINDFAAYFNNLVTPATTVVALIIAFFALKYQALEFKLSRLHVRLERYYVDFKQYEDDYFYLMEKPIGLGTDSIFTLYEYIELGKFTHNFHSAKNFVNNIPNILNNEKTQDIDDEGYYQLKHLLEIKNTFTKLVAATVDIYNITRQLKNIGEQPNYMSLKALEQKMFSYKEDLEIISLLSDNDTQTYMTPTYVESLIKIPSDLNFFHY